MMLMIAMCDLCVVMFRQEVCREQWCQVCLCVLLPGSRKLVGEQDH